MHTATTANVETATRNVEIVVVVAAAVVAGIVGLGVGVAVAATADSHSSFRSSSRSRSRRHRSSSGSSSWCRVSRSSSSSSSSSSSLSVCSWFVDCSCCRKYSRQHCRYQHYNTDFVTSPSCLLVLLHLRRDFGTPEDLEEKQIVVLKEGNWYTNFRSKDPQIRVTRITE